jgi:putative lipoic acid-binding regulatory protein
MKYSHREEAIASLIRYPSTFEVSLLGSFFPFIFLISIKGDALPELIKIS